MNERRYKYLGRSVSIGEFVCDWRRSRRAVNILLPLSVQICAIVRLGTRVGTRDWPAQASRRQGRNIGRNVRLFGRQIWFLQKNKNIQNQVCILNSHLIVKMLLLCQNITTSMVLLRIKREKKGMKEKKRKEMRQSFHIVNYSWDISTSKQRMGGNCSSGTRSDPLFTLERTFPQSLRHQDGVCGSICWKQKKVIL